MRLNEVKTVEVKLNRECTHLNPLLVRLCAAFVPRSTLISAIVTMALFV